MLVNSIKLEESLKYSIFGENKHGVPAEVYVSGSKQEWYDVSVYLYINGRYQYQDSSKIRDIDEVQGAIDYLIRSFQITINQ